MKKIFLLLLLAAALPSAGFAQKMPTVYGRFYQTNGKAKVVTSTVNETLNMQGFGYELDLGVGEHSDKEFFVVDGVLGYIRETSDPSPTGNQLVRSGEYGGIQISKKFGEYFYISETHAVSQSHYHSSTIAGLSDKDKSEVDLIQRTILGLHFSHVELAVIFQSGNAHILPDAASPTAAGNIRYNGSAISLGVIF
ncbi:MAG: hypothetical protein OEV94_00815 [Deltaproteobacteria bacterium]|nr:hypothetical protein [Deltaproteobacteria bacterium]